MNGRDLLRKTAEAFETGALKWARAQSNRLPEGCHCALTGMQDVLSMEDCDDDGPWREARRALAITICPDEPLAVPGAIIIDWNDAPERTEQEVIDMMRKAAA